MKIVAIIQDSELMSEYPSSSVMRVCSNFASLFTENETDTLAITVNQIAPTIERFKKDESEDEFIYVKVTRNSQLTRYEFLWENEEIFLIGKAGKSAKNNSESRILLLGQNLTTIERTTVLIKGLAYLRDILHLP